MRNRDRYPKSRGYPDRARKGFSSKDKDAGRTGSGGLERKAVELLDFLLIQGAFIEDIAVGVKV